MKLNLLRGIKNALLLILSGDWNYFVVRLRISLGQVDLKHDFTEKITDRTHYYADSSGLEFEKIISRFDIKPGDAIVDFGCGKGGTLISLSRFPFFKILGVEIAPDLVAIAKRNLKTLKLKKVQIVCSDASKFYRLNDFNFFYFFDPFPAVVMRDVIRNIEDSIRLKPRNVTVIYLNPFCHNLFEESELFKKTEEIPHFEHKCFVYKNIS